MRGCGRAPGQAISQAFPDAPPPRTRRLKIAARSAPEAVLSPRTPPAPWPSPLPPPKSLPRNPLAMHQTPFPQTLDYFFFWGDSALLGRGQRSLVPTLVPPPPASAALRGEQSAYRGVSAPDLLNCELVEFKETLPGRLPHRKLLRIILLLREERKRGERERKGMGRGGQWDRGRVRVATLRNGPEEPGGQTDTPGNTTPRGTRGIPGASPGPGSKRPGLLGAAPGLHPPLAPNGAPTAQGDGAHLAGGRAPLLGAPSPGHPVNSLPNAPLNAPSLPRTPLTLQRPPLRPPPHRTPPRTLFALHPFMHPPKRNPSKHFVPSAPQ